MKRNRVITGVGATILALVVGGCVSPGPISNLPATLHPQETSMWCWAASGQMVMNYLGTDVAQCTQANNRFGRTDCPCNQCGGSPISGPPCVQGGWPEFNKYGFTFRRTSDAALSWDDLTEELSQCLNCGSTPIAFSWHWSGGGGHMMVVTGFVEVNGARYVAIHDPWAPCTGDTRIITYSAYVSGSSYTHWDDFYEIRD